MTRRCQSCLRPFPGDVCPGCGMDHLIHVEVRPAERVSEHPDRDPRKRRHANNGVGRQATCLRPGCGRRIPAGKGPARYCSGPCKQEARRETYLASKRRRRSA